MPDCLYLQTDQGEGPYLGAGPPLSPLPSLQAGPTDILAEAQQYSPCTAPAPLGTCHHAWNPEAA